MPAYMYAGGRGSEDEIVWNRDDGSGSCDGSCRSRSREETAPGSGDWGFRDECESPGGSGSGAACKGFSCLSFFFRLKPLKTSDAPEGTNTPVHRICFHICTHRWTWKRLPRLPLLLHTGTCALSQHANKRASTSAPARTHARTHARARARLKLEVHREMEEVWMGAASDLLSLRGETGSGAAASGGVTARSVFVFFESGRPGA